MGEYDDDYLLFDCPGQIEVNIITILMLTKYCKCIKSIFPVAIHPHSTHEDAHETVAGYVQLSRLYRYRIPLL